jgi:D-glycero-alpha-D-manno-heptose-7-phosphate kinase
MILTRTPYRISFFGGGTDYPAWFEKFGEGAVLSTTIDKYCYLACRYMPPFFDTKSRIVWSKIELVNAPEEIEHPAVRELLQYLSINEGLEIHHYGDLPHRSGMGSSSSFIVGLLHTLHLLRGRDISKRDLALDAIHVEQERMGQNVGCQDQTAAAYGGFNRITFGGHEKIAVRPVAMTPEMKGMLEERLLIYFTGLSRTASEVAGEQIRATQTKERELRTMLGLVDEAEKILGNGPHGLDDFGRLLHETWMLKKGLTKAVTNDAIDAIYERARKAGALGGKLLGAGGGGFLLFYVPPEKREDVKQALKDVLNVPFRFEDEGSKVIYTDAH